MEDGGCCSLFEFVNKAHGLILRGMISMTEWHRVAKIIFKQMIESVQFIHSKRICHLDISLENYLINDISVELNCNGQIRFCAEEIQVKMCGMCTSTL